MVMDEEPFTAAIGILLNGAYRDGGGGFRVGFRVGYTAAFIRDQAKDLRELCFLTLTESEREAITCAYVNSITDPHRAAVLAERDKTGTDEAS